MRKMTEREIADGLLWPIWRGIPDAYKVKYARSIWDQFESNIRSAAYTSSPANFLEAICRKMNSSIRTEDMASMVAALESEPVALLMALRDQTTLLVVHCRLKNQERKEQMQREDA